MTERSIVDFFNALRRLNIKLWSEGGQLRFSAPPGAFTPALRAEVAGCKTELLVLLQEAKAAAVVHVPPLLPVPRDHDLALSFAQQRLWFLDQLEPGSATYNMPIALRLRGPLNAAALERSLSEIIRRHEILRTSFPNAGSSPVQRIAPFSPLSLPVIDLQNLPSAERLLRAEQLFREDCRQPFDLARGPLLRASLLRLEETDHVWLLNMHHIVSDGWSMGIFFRELSELYAAFASGRPSRLPEMAIQYADFSQWQQTWLQGEVLEQEIAFWKKQLGGAPAVLELPSDYPRPTVQSYRGARKTITVSPAVTTALKRLSQQAGATLFMTLLAAFKAWLHRLSGQTDLIVGTPIAGRNRLETEPLIGFFVNTQVLRSNVSGDPTFREFLATVRDTALEAYAHQDLPFEKLVEELKPERSLSFTPLFQVMFDFKSAPDQELGLPGIQESELIEKRGTVLCDLSLTLTDGTVGLTGSLSYATDLFNEDTIQRWLRHFQTLLAAIASNSDQRLSALPLLTEPEQQQLLVEWNDTRMEYPKDVCLHDLIAAQAERTPAACAVSFEGRELTYAELNRCASQLAVQLRQLGVGPESLVAICMERSLEMIVGILAVLKAGGAYVPLDPNYPPDRLAYMLADTQAKVLLTQSHLVASLSANQAAIIFLDQLALDASDDSNHSPSTTHPTRGVNANDLAYVIYTSGSTGRPKGVMVTHRNLVNAYFAWEKAYELPPEFMHLSMASFSFDVFSGDLVRALCSGGKLILCPREVLMEPDQLYALMRREKVVYAEFVPIVLRGLMEYVAKTGQSLDFMRVLIAGSDSWYVREYQEYQRFIGPATRLINSYGLTEATVDSSYFESRQVDRPQEALVPIGRPFANTQLYVLDGARQPVPIGVRGELYVGGDAVARGYLNRPELTAERFIPNPFSDEPDAQLYRTGDMVRYLPDGNLELLGRSDNQVKIRGFRVELGEIEALLGNQPGVKDAVVIAREEASGGKRLVGYLVTDPHSPPDIANLRNTLKEQLPDYMVPAAFVVLDALPQTPNGKVDRRALPAPDWSRCVEEASFVAPRNASEEIIAGIWAAVLKLERVGVNHNFFDLGGHSLLATQVISRLRAAFKIELPLRCLFEWPTVAGLAEAAANAERNGSKSAMPPIRRVSREQYRLKVSAPNAAPTDNSVSPSQTLTR